MRYVVDLHSHSGYAGGVGAIDLPDVARTMAKKGIHAFGTGDCLQPAWLDALDRRLDEKEPGLFALRATGADRVLNNARFVLQSEIIVTCAVPSGGRKGTHVVLCFPGVSAAREALALLRRHAVKVDMGRPFVKCDDAAAVAGFFTELAAVDPGILVMPAHVLTPQGVYGSDHPVDSLADVFGDFAPRIRCVETGLSADPELLSLLPELDGRTLVSNSDCHSPALNRVGREFTALDLDGSPSYEAIVKALRAGRVAYTAEFHPAEGRYFLTGHRAGLEGHGDAYCYFSPDRVPADGRCPICGKALTVGVLDRVLHLARAQAPKGKAPRTLDNAKPRQIGHRLVPLVEVVAAGLGVKSVTSAKVLAAFEALVKAAGTEAALWEWPEDAYARDLAGVAPGKVIDALAEVRAGRFAFEPPGYDGTYGRLTLGAAPAWFGHEKVFRGT